MTDQLDQAQEFSERYRQSAIARSRCNTVIAFTRVTRERQCTDCDQHIPLARLTAVPSTIRCVACAATNERK